MNERDWSRGYIAIASVSAMHAALTLAKIFREGVSSELLYHLAVGLFPVLIAIVMVFKTRQQTQADMALQ